MNSLHCCIGIIGMLLIIFGAFKLVSRKPAAAWHERTGDVEITQLDGQKYIYSGSRKQSWDWSQIKQTKEI